MNKLRDNVFRCQDITCPERHDCERFKQRLTGPNSYESLREGIEEGLNCPHKLNENSYRWHEFMKVAR